MGLRQDLRQVAVAFVGDDDGRARLGDQEIRSRDADVGGKEFGAKHAAGLGEQLFGLRQIPVRRQVAVRLAKLQLDVLL